MRAKVMLDDVRNNIILIHNHAAESNKSDKIKTQKIRLTKISKWGG